MIPFHLKKHYFDLISDEGTVLYLYFINAKIASLCRGIVSAHLRTPDARSYEAALQRPVMTEGSDSLEAHPCCMVTEPDCCRVHIKSEQLEIDLRYYAAGAPWFPAGQAPILRKGNRLLIWTVPFPCAHVSGVVRAGGREWTVTGAGYQDLVEMSIPPWRLPVIELVWGRAHCEKRTFIFNRLRTRAGTTLQYALIRRGGNGEDSALLQPMAIEAGQEDRETEIRCADATLRLTLDSVLRAGEIAGGGQIRPRLLANVLSGISGRPFEKKMLSKAELEFGGNTFRGWAIHERVVWDWARAATGQEEMR
jgi:hypothetical protein